MMSHRYQEVTSPKVKFLLVEVEKDNGTFYSDTLYDSDPMQPNGNKKLFLNAETTLMKLVQTQNNSEADVVVLVSGMDITGVSGGVLNPNVAGRAYVGAVCAVTYKVAVVEDMATTYSGVSVLSHELGHALGMPHDGERPQWPDPTNPWTQCKPSDEYLMAPTDGGRNSGYFSHCSIRAFRTFVRTLKADCFLVKSTRQHSQIPQNLPGTGMDATTLCRRIYSTFKDVRSQLTPVLNQQCKLQCCIHDLGYCYTKNMIDGMTCGYLKTCVRHRCGYHGRKSPPQQKTTGTPNTTTELTRSSTPPIAKITTPMPPAPPKPRPPYPHEPPAPPSSPFYPRNPQAPPSPSFNPHLPPAPPRRQKTGGFQKPYTRIPPVTRRKHVHEEWPAARNEI